MPRRLLSIVLLALAAGVLVGVLVAAVVPRTRAADQSQPSAAAPPTSARPAPEPRTGIPVPANAGGTLLLRPTGAVTLQARASDPLGGPDWALRIFQAKRVTPKNQRRPNVSPILGRSRCVQLGRIHHGRFGWIDASNTFRRVGVGFNGAPIKCGRPQANMRGNPILRTQTLVAGLAGPDPRLTETVIWGLAGPAARSASLTLDGTARAVALSPAGAFVTFAAPQLRSDQVSARVRYDGGEVQIPRLRPSVAAASPTGPPAPSPRPTQPSGPARLIARAPDPNGGLPWGLSIRTAKDVWCTSTGRIIGDRVGQVDFRLGTFSDAAESSSCGTDAALTTRNPVLLQLSLAAGALPQNDPSFGRVARRTPPGTSLIGGRALASVRQITIKTPNDVRTLIPAGPQHAFLAAYAGGFPTGQLIVSALLADGSTHTTSLPLGNP